MTNLRKAASGRPCQIRLPRCDGGGETTVLAHYRLAGLNGTGMKPPDLCAAHACHTCHGVVDRRFPPPLGYTKEAVRLAHAEGCLRTLAVLAAEGLVSAK